MDLMEVLHGCSTATELLAYWARDREHHVAYTFLKDGEIEDAQLTFGDLSRRSRAVARDQGEPRTELGCANLGLDH